MKKFLTLCVSALCALAVNADEALIGNEDNTSAWWTAFSNYYSINADQSAHITFTNYSDQAETWHNWLLIANVTGTQRGADDYSEYFVLRNDNYGWGGTAYDASTFVSNYKWDTFKADMDGSTVDMTLSMKGEKIAMTATITTTSGTVYNYSYTSLSTGTDKADFFFTTECGHISNLKVEYVEADKEAANSIGNTDNTSAWWTAFSDYYKVYSDTTTTITFTNYSDEAETYHNWLLVAHKLDTQRGGTGYLEYFVLRNDNYGWGDDYFDASTLSNDFEWGTFFTDMDGAKVSMTLTINESQQIVMNAVITTKGGTEYHYSHTSKSIGANAATWFLTTECGHITNLNVVNTYKGSTGINNVATEAQGATEAYNIAGQKVANSYKGIMIKNGHKYLNK